MKKAGLKKLILKHLENNYPTWIHKGELGRLAVNEWGYENENMGRRCRELVTAGLIEKDPNSIEAIYRYIPKKSDDLTIQRMREEALFSTAGMWGRDV